MNLLSKIFLVLVCLALPFGVAAQSKTRKNTGKKPNKTVKKPAAAEPVADTPEKKVEAVHVPADPGVKMNRRDTAATSPAQDKPKTLQATHFYYFTQPDFETSSIFLEHDNKGFGKISFQKKGLDEPISDPIQVSPAALERISAALKSMNYFDSTENYQYEKDYSHLGNIKIRVKDGDRERTITFNWTAHKDAKALADEYRKIANQAIWAFEVTVARENQPLEAPRKLDNLDALIRRGEISDTAQMLPLLQGLSNDERIPLIARNHAAKLIKQIEKNNKK